MEHQIVHITEKNLIGQAMEMSLDHDRTVELFTKFMPRRKDISNQIDHDLVEVMIYDSSYFMNFSPSMTFTKWVCVAVEHVATYPEEMKQLIIKDGLYAVFTYKGHSAEFGKFMNAILVHWLPKSKYMLDDRPHFNILGAKYKNAHPDSEEEVYIPIKIIV